MARLDDLDRRLKAFDREGSKGGAREREARRAKGAGAGARLVTELLAGVLGGLLLGWFIDRRAGTAPFALLLCLLLGAAGAFNNVLKESRPGRGRAQDGKE